VSLKPIQESSLGRAIITPALTRDQLHVWSARCPSEARAELKQILSIDELVRADRFHFERDRNNFINRRGFLRLILASYLEVAPTAVNFTYNDFGKPNLQDSARAGMLTFSVSHSREHVRIAVAADKKVGIDVEVVDEKVPIDSIAKTFFSNTELFTLQRLPDAIKCLGFFSCWTRKEAYVKARGKGLSIPLDSFNVSIQPGGPPDLIMDSRTAEVWKVDTIERQNGYLVSVAAQGNAWNLISCTFHL